MAHIHRLIAVFTGLAGLLFSTGFAITFAALANAADLPDLSGKTVVVVTENA